MDKFAENLLTALKEPQIQKRVKEIVAEEDKILESPFVSDDETQWSDRIMCLSQDLNTKKEECIRLEQEIEYLKRTNELFLENYGSLNAHYQSYISLEEGIHKELSRVLSAASPDEFLCWGSQWGNIEALWQFMDISLAQNRHETETMTVLGDIFDYLFGLYCSATGNYERIPTVVGDIFDEEIHKRYGESRVAGRITQVLLQGYRGVYNKKIQKSIVQI